MRLKKGENPRLVDEWEIAPQVWDSIRFESDHLTATGDYAFRRADGVPGVPVSCLKN